MNAITAAELAAMRADAKALLYDTCDIYTRSNTSDGQGGQTVTETSETAVPCILAPMDSDSDDARDLDNIEENAVGWLLKVPYDQAIVSGQRVVHGGRSYEVVAVHDKHTFRLTNRAVLKRVS